jgi:hypothetical protein
MAAVDRDTIWRAKALVAASFGVHGRAARQLEYLADSAQLSSAAFEQKVSGFGSR